MNGKHPRINDMRTKATHKQKNIASWNQITFDFISIDRVLPTNIWRDVLEAWRIVVEVLFGKDY